MPPKENNANNKTKEKMGTQSYSIRRFLWNRMVTLCIVLRFFLLLKFSLRCLYKGVGVPQDYLGAFEWFLKSAEDGVFLFFWFHLFSSFFKGWIWTVLDINVLLQRSRDTNGLSRSCDMVCLLLTFHLFDFFYLGQQNQLLIIT